MSQITLKQVNKFRPRAFVVGSNGHTQDRGKTIVPLDQNGYLSLEPGTYEVVFNEDFNGDLTGVLESFVANCVTFWQHTYSTPEGTATLMTVSNGHLLIQPGSTIAIDRSYLNYSSPKLIKKTLEPTNNGDQPKRRPGRPPKKKEEEKSE